MVVTVKQNRQIDVEFSLLNGLTARLRSAGARITVRKVGKLYRIILLKEPTVASLEEIFSYVNDATDNYVYVEVAQTKKID